MTSVMLVKKVIQVNVGDFPEGQRAALVRSNASLTRQIDHHRDCPVRYGASATCVWPVAVCVPECWCSGFDHEADCYENK